MIERVSSLSFKGNIRINNANKISFQKNEEEKAKLHPWDTFEKKNPFNFDYDANSDEWDGVGKLPVIWYRERGTKEFFRTVDSKELGLYNATQEHYKNMSEYFFLYSDRDIQDLSSQFIFSGKHRLNAYRSNSKSQSAYNDLLYYVKQTRYRYANLQKEKMLLETANSSGLSDLSEIKDDIIKKIATPIMKAAEYEPAEFPNKILLYGNSQINREKIIDYLVDIPTVDFIEVKYDYKDPKKAFDNLETITRHCKDKFEFEGKRHVIKLSGFDEMMRHTKEVEPNKLYARALINRMDKVCELTNSILVIDTDLPLERINESPLDETYFSLKYCLDRENFDLVGKKRLDVVQAEIDRLEAKANVGIDKFTTIAWGKLPERPDEPEIPDCYLPGGPPLI